MVGFERTGADTLWRLSPLRIVLNVKSLRENDGKCDRGVASIRVLLNSMVKNPHEMGSKKGQREDHDERSIVRKLLKGLAPQAGFEPATLRLTA